MILSDEYSIILVIIWYYGIIILDNSLSFLKLIDALEAYN